MKHHPLLPLSGLALCTALMAGCSGDDGLNGAPGADAVEQTISLSLIGRYETGEFDESASEIVAFDPATDQMYIVNALLGELEIVDLADPTTPTSVTTLSVADGISSSLSVDAADIGGPNSVSVHDGVVAVAVEANPKTSNGWVAFYQATDGAFLSAVEVGALPDMVTFTPDGNYVLTANEGEPNDDYSVDPEGSVSIIDVSGGVSTVTATNVATAAFTDFNTGGSRAAELPSTVRIFGPGASVAQDLEPEYLSVSTDSATAWVSLQENNAIAEIDLSAGTVTSIWALGFKDYGLFGNELDASNEDGPADGPAINIRNWPVLGMYQPDTIASYDFNGTTYLVTANEGDARDYDTFSEEIRIKDIADDFSGTVSPDGVERFTFNGAIDDDRNLGRLRITSTLGYDTAELGCSYNATTGEPAGCTFTQLYSYGARSFSIWNTETGAQVFDSGSDFERITAQRLGANGFNASNDNNDLDDRSDDKGPEPEALTLAQINGRTYAFIGLERVGGIMVYDISRPEAPEFVQYITNRDFSATIDTSAAGDLGPEGMAFIPAENSPNGSPLLLVGNEISGSTAIFQIDLISLSDD